MKTLRPQPIRDAYFKPIEKDLVRIFRETLFDPLIAIVRDSTAQKIVLNAAPDPLEQALRTGRIQYDPEKGQFSGSFSAATSRALRALGATFDSRNGTYSLDPARVPANIRIIAQQSEAVARSTHDSLLRALDDAHERIEAAGTALAVGADGMIDRVQADFETIAKGITVTPELTDQGKKNMADDYNKNMALSIKGWQEEQIEKLRDQVEQNAQAGYRFEGLIERIEHEYDVTKSKAAFLARQETGLYVAKFRRETFSDMGVEGYVWQARGKGLTRPSHWALNDRVFKYNTPPVVDPATQRHANPGEDFNCLCLDRPILGRISPEMMGQVRRAA